MEYVSLLSILICVLLIAAVSRRIQGTIITLPMIYVTLDLLLGGQFLNLVNTGGGFHFVHHYRL